MHSISQVISKFPAMKYTGTSRMNRNVLEKGYEILGAVKGANKITHVWGYDPDVNNGEHHSGRALDLMVFNNTALGNDIAAYLAKNQKRLGIVHFMWRQRKWRGDSSGVSPKHVYVNMEDRGSGTENHMDHIHVLFDATAYRAPGIVTRVKVAVSGKGASSLGKRQLHLTKPQMSGNDVKYVQRFLGVKVDGYYGPNTRAAVIRYQKMRGLKVDGYVGPVTWRNLLSK